MTKKFIKCGLLLFMIGTFFISGCQQRGEMKAQSLENMAANESIQKSFSDGRRKTIEKNNGTAQFILENTIAEQQYMLNDKELRSRLLQVNIGLNKMMTHEKEGQEQLMDSTLTIMQRINEDQEQHRRLSHIQNQARKKALKDKELRTSILGQNIQEFRAIAEQPALRSEMADNMILLMKDPKIQKEMQKMIKMVVAQEMKKLKEEMQSMQQQMMSQMQQGLQEKGSQKGSQKVPQTPHNSENLQPNAQPEEQS